MKCNDTYNAFLSVGVTFCKKHPPCHLHFGTWDEGRPRVCSKVWFKSAVSHNVAG